MRLVIVETGRSVYIVLQELGIVCCKFTSQLREKGFHVVTLLYCRKGAEVHLSLPCVEHWMMQYKFIFVYVHLCLSLCFQVVAHG